jgi:hypothetical protein
VTAGGRAGRTLTFRILLRMAGAPRLDWIYEVGAWTLAGVGAVLLLWALFWDRPRGRRRCPKCWYDMAGVPGLTCPECGRSAKSERKLYKTRRRWGWISIATPLTIAGPVVEQFPSIRDQGWIGAIPTWALVWIAPVDENAWKWSGIPSLDRPRACTPTQPLLVEMLERADRNELSDWEWRVFLSRLYSAAPDQLGWLLQTRGRCLRDTPVRFNSGGPLFFDPRPSCFVHGWPMVVRARIKGSGNSWTECPVDSAGTRGEASLGPPPRGAGSLEIEGELLFSRIADGKTVRTRVWHGDLRTVKVVDSAEELLTPIADSEWGGVQIREDLDPALFREYDGSVWLLFSAKPYRPRFTWSLGFQVEVLHDGQSVATGQGLYGMEGQSIRFTARDGVRDLYPLQWTQQPAPSGDLGPGKWTIRLRGDARMAAQDRAREDYWGGVLEVPARLLPPTSLPRP